MEKHPVVRILGQSKVPPFMFKSGPNEGPRGISIDYITLALKKVGLKGDFSGFIPLRESHDRLEKKEEIDLIPLAIVTPTNARRWALTSPYFTTPIVVFSRSDLDTSRTLKDFFGKKLAYSNSARYMGPLIEKYKKIQWTAYNAPRLALQSVATGLEDGFVGALAVGAYLIRDRGLLNLKVAARTEAPDLKMAFAVRKDNKILADILSKGIKSISDDEHAQIRNKWVALDFNSGIPIQQLIAWASFVGVFFGTLAIIFMMSYGRLKKEVIKRKEIEDELEQLNARLRKTTREVLKASEIKENFLSTISHELRTPLTSIIGALSFVNSGMAGTLSDEGKRLIEIASRNSSRLLTLINELLDTQKMGAGKLVLEKTPLPIANLLEQALEANTGFALHHGVTLAADTPFPLGEINGDQGRLLQVFANLISNAVKFTPPRQVVTISARIEDGYVHFSVKDRGPGIPCKFQHKIFQKFTTEEDGTMNRTSGTGLGLNIAKNLVELHGGEIRFETTEGRGTTFFFSIPLHHQHQVSLQN
ncbi:ATP-binding protein [Varunaivibrio sulfuroxidans]|uniref:ATP-binding protein n=1 Tax=Varunaivibrio sulfuroxidans TaxID=1773489 RepID=UPI00140428D1|nr:ATP-binding protein [Varunaivibrio sulfuroxidans]WES31189.1 ATP-binding protein [Varunaivibrio sulfuroxidans]